jgi:hypothetical protein
LIARSSSPSFRVTDERRKGSSVRCRSSSATPAAASTIVLDPDTTIKPTRTKDPIMKRMTFPTRLLTAAIISAAAAAGVAADAAHAGPDGPDVPDRIDVEDGHKVFLVGHAVGVQIYRCDTIPGGHTWNFVAPRADLRDDGGKLLTTHFGGPTWQAKDGSAVVAKRVDGVTMDETAIPWLLLKKDSATAGPDGDRLMSTTFIQRTNTTGGQFPPASECGASSAGTTKEVPYTADYYFWKKIEV